MKRSIGRIFHGDILLLIVGVRLLTPPPPPPLTHALTVYLVPPRIDFFKFPLQF